MVVTSDDYYNHFAHHGVKGMKWGVRHDKKSSGSGKSKGKTATSKVSSKPDTRSEQRKQSDTIRSKKTNQLTNEELQQAISRMNLERQYKNLNRELYHPGQQFTSKALNQFGGIAIGAASGYVIKKGAPAALKVAKKAIRR